MWEIIQKKNVGNLRLGREFELNVGGEMKKNMEKLKLISWFRLSFVEKSGSCGQNLMSELLDKVIFY